MSWPFALGPGLKSPDDMASGPAWMAWPRLLELALLLGKGTPEAVASSAALASAAYAALASGVPYSMSNARDRAVPLQILMAFSISSFLKPKDSTFVLSHVLPWRCQYAQQWAWNPECSFSVVRWP